MSIQEVPIPKDGLPRTPARKPAPPTPGGKGRPKGSNLEVREQRRKEHLATLQNEMELLAIAMTKEIKNNINDLDPRELDSYCKFLDRVFQVTPGKAPTPTEATDPAEGKETGYMTRPGSLSKMMQDAQV